MAQNEIWTIGRILKWTEQYFGTKGVEAPRLDAEVLLSHVLKKERIYLYVHFDEPLEPEELTIYREYIKKRIQRMPVAYIIGQREFMGLPFRVTPDVLVPRPDTEILVQAVMDRLKAAGNEEQKAQTIADIGTGSGAICLSLLHYLPRLQAVTVDISPAALAVARENAAALELAERIEFREGDLLEPLAGQCFQAIVSNPPYIPKADILGLEPEVREYEPMGALDGGRTGMDFYERLLAGAAPLLAAGGFLALEAGIHQAEPITELAARNPAWGRQEVLKDYGGIDRVVVLWKK